MNPLMDVDISSPVYPADPVKFSVSTLVKNSGEHGLNSVSVDTLTRCLEPVLAGLASMEAETLLNLQRVSEGGAQLRRGVRIRPIHQDIEPSCDPQTVRYIHLSETPGQYSMGIFVFPPHAKIPLHDHPGMCVLSRVLYGDLHRLSLDLARESDPWDDWQDPESSSSLPGHDASTSSAGSMDIDKPTNKRQQPSSSPKKTESKRSSWLPSFLHNSGGDSDSDDPLAISNSSVQNQMPAMPTGSKRAYRNRIDYLQAPECTALYPYEGNLHEFVAGKDGAAVLDVLLPPYDVEHNRDCTFYEIQECKKSPAQLLHPHQEPCWIIPSGQPEDFHCISGKYRDIGASS